MNTSKGRCVCGEVTFTLHQKIKNVINCHCNFCKAHSGAAFASYAFTAFDDVEITTGKDRINTYTVDGGIKHFCRNCGTPLYNINDKYPDACMVYLGTLENVGKIKPRFNIWTENKLGWVDDISSIRSLPRGFEKK